MKLSDCKADAIKYAEIKGQLPVARDGGGPKSIRKRGYYRALKRNELWAINEKNKQDMINSMSRQLFDSYAPKIIEDLGMNGQWWRSLSVK